MADYEKVAKGLEWILEGDRFGFGKGTTKPECDEEKAGCFIHDALELIKCQQETIDELISADKALKEIVHCKECKKRYSIDCSASDRIFRPDEWFCGDGERRTDDACAMLKEQEIKYPVCEKCGKKIDHIITSVFNSYDGSDSEYSFPITYDEDGGCIQFSTTQNWTGYELSDTEQKDGIRCPFCHEFPFDANEEIELYEPEEVVVMMWESR